jgi:LPXTG-motif cell wall-anchored protein
VKKYENENLVTKYEVYNSFHNDRFYIYDDNNLVVYGDAGYKIIAANVPEVNNNTTTEPAATKPATTESSTAKSTTTNNTALVNLDTNKLNKNGVNEISPVPSSDSQAVEARIDASAVNGGTGSLKMNASNVTMELPFSAVDYDGTVQGSYISVKQNIIANDPLLSAIKDIGKVFDFSLATYKQDGTKIKDIHNFKNGKAKISVKLTNDDIKNLDTAKLSAFYYNEETKMWESVGGSFDKESMTFTFETSHFSKYTIAQTNGALPQTGSALNSLDLIVIGLILMVFGTLIFSRKVSLKHMLK